MSSKNFSELGFVKVKQGFDQEVEKINVEAMNSQQPGDFVVQFVVNGRLNTVEQEQLIDLANNQKEPCTHLFTKDGVMITLEQFKEKIAKTEFNCENLFGKNIPSPVPPLLSELSFTRLLPVLVMPDHAQPVPSLPASDSFAAIASSNPNAAIMPMLSSLESDQSLFARLQTLLEESKVKPLPSDNSFLNEKQSYYKLSLKTCFESFVF